MTLISRRHALAGAGALLGANALGIGAAAAGSGAIPPGLTLRAATFRGQDQTLLAGAGLDHTPYRLAFSEFNAGNLITQAINAGALDFGGWSEIPLVFAAAADARIRVVATLEGPTVNQAVLVPKTSAAKSVADLRGKRVGYIRATTAHYFLIKMLARHGLSFADIQPIALGMSEALTAFRAGALDAWATYGYAIATLQYDDSARVLQNAVGILSGNYLLGATPDKLDDPAFRAVLADYIDRLNRAYRVFDADKARWARLVAPVISVPEPITLAYLRNEEKPYQARASRPGDIASAQDVADTFIAAGLLPKGTNVAPYFSDKLSPLLKQA